MAAEILPVAPIDEYAKPCEPAIHVLRSVGSFNKICSPVLPHWVVCFLRVHHRL